MGFSIGRFLGSIAGPVIGGLIGGAPGAAVGAAISSGFEQDTAQAATIGRATQPGPISVSVQAPNPQFSGFPIAPTSIAPSFQTASLVPVLRGARDIATGVGISQFFGGNGNGKSPISQILARARQATGGPVTRNKIIDAAKVCGLETAASTFGLDVRQVCMVVVKGRTRRRRGVSAADIRRTKRTIGFASKIRKDLKALAR